MNSLQVVDLSVSALWRLVLIVLSFIVWRELRHWSVLLIFIAQIPLLGEDTIAATLILSRPLGLYFSWPLRSQLMNFMSIVHVIGCFMGAIGGIGVLIALRKKRWNLQALRTPAEAA